MLFAEPDVEGLIEGIKLFEKNRERISPTVCRENALRFAPDRFRAEFAGFVRRSLAALGDSQASAQPASFYPRAASAAGG